LFSSRSARIIPWEISHGSHSVGGWIESRACLEAGWDPQPVWRPGGIHSPSGGRVGSTACLEAGWDPQPVWRPGGIQSLSGGRVGFRACLEAGWDPQPVWRPGDIHSWSGGRVVDPQPVWRPGAIQSRSGGRVGPTVSLEAEEKKMSSLLADNRTPIPRSFRPSATQHCCRAVPPSTTIKRQFPNIPLMVPIQCTDPHPILCR
jgi:hypothetical protein